MRSSQTFPNFKPKLRPRMSSPQVPARIAALRKAMAQANLQAWIIPATDPHQSEYFSPHWQAREYFSGFSGSAGTLVVTAQAAGLWTDSRYYLQAEQQLPHGVVSLFKSQEAGVPTFIKWLAEVLPCGAKVGMDGWLLSAKEKIGRKAELAAQFMELDLNHDISAQAWESRPALPTGSVFEHPMHLAGQSRVEKLNALRDLRHRSISMDLPVALGIAVTFAVSTAATFEPSSWWGHEVYFDSLTMFVFFLLSGRWLEQRLRTRTAGSLDLLARRLPDSELVIYPDAGHGGIFQFHDQFVQTALDFLDRDVSPSDRGER